MNILVSGGAGYIGSHTVIELINAGFTPIILDNFSTSDKKAIDCIEEVTSKKVTYFEGDFDDMQKVSDIIKKNDIKGIIHFAAYKAVGESVEQPLKYYENNVSGFINLLSVASKHHVPVVFSSSAAVYGSPDVDVVTEDTACKPESPYGSSKLMDEIILQDACKGATQLKGIALRYFNVVGAHDSGKIGEMPKLPPANLLPIIVQATAGLREPLTVYGNDYDTPDGTCLRDYVHVVDLANAHITALNHLLKQDDGYYDVFNVGTGKPTSVLELISTFEKVNNVRVPHTIGPRRQGDPMAYSANTTKIEKILGWHAKKSVEDAARSAWTWQLKLQEEAKGEV